MKVYSIYRIDDDGCIDFIGTFDTIEKANDVVKSDVEDIGSRVFGGAEYGFKQIRDDDRCQMFNLSGYSDYLYIVFKTELNSVFADKANHK